MVQLGCIYYGWYICISIINIIYGCIIIPIMNNNMIQQNNNRDIALGFKLTRFVYCMARTFGAFAVAGALANNQKQDGKNGLTLLDYYPLDNPLLIQVLLILQLTLVFQVLQFIAKSQFFGLIYQLERQPKWQFYAFSLTYALTCLIVQCVEVALSLIISLCWQIYINCERTVIGLFQEYIIPIALHLNCLYAKKGSQTQNQQIIIKFKLVLNQQNIQQIQLILLNFDQMMKRIQNVMIIQNFQNVWVWNWQIM